MVFGDRRGAAEDGRRNKAGAEQGVLASGGRNGQWRNDGKPWKHAVRLTGDASAGSALKTAPPASNGLPQPPPFNVNHTSFPLPQSRGCHQRPPWESWEWAEMGSTFNGSNMRAASGRPKHHRATLHRQAQTLP